MSRAPIPAEGNTVGDVLAALERRAPLRLAADWDNVGLVLGAPERRVRRALLAIDLTDAVAREALRSRCELLVLYHPPIFKGIRRITAGAEGPTSLLPELLAAGVSAVALHTALDAAPAGTNDVLLDVFEPAERYPLEPTVRDAAQCKLVVFVPPDEADALRSALSAAGAGTIGHYDECSFELRGRGSFRGDESTNPTVGVRGRLERVDELRLEMVVPAARLSAVVRALHAAHSYEEPAYDIYPLRDVAARGAGGMGRVGVLRRPTRGGQLIAQISALVDMRGATVIGDLKRSFARVIAAAGSFGTRSLRDPQALVLTGELKHHDALEMLRAGVTVVCLGHWASERPVLTRLAEWLRADLPRLRVMLSKADSAPLTPLDGVPPEGKRRA